MLTLLAHAGHGLGPVHFHAHDLLALAFIACATLLADHVAASLGVR